MRNTIVASVALVLVVILIGFGACGVLGGGDPPATTTTTTTSAAPTTTTTTAVPTTTTHDPATLETLPPVDGLGAPTLTRTSSVSTVGIDQVQFGMTAHAAQKAAGSRFTPVSPIGECYRATPDAAPDGITFWIVDGTVERVDIDTTEITTRSGAGIGDTEDRIREMFGERIVSSPMPDGSGNLLAYVPRDESDKAFRVMFVSDGSTIVRFWSGRLPWAEILIGGCPAVSG
jgi:hypothetical protein